MIKHPTTPFTDHYSYPEVQLRKGLIPYSDLKARGQYDRWLELPRDIIPVLDIPTVQAPNEPKLVTGQNDGSVNVHVMNQSGGGVSPVVLDSFDNEGGSNIETTGDFLIIPQVSFTKPILLLDVFVIPSFKDFASAQYGFCNIQFADSTRLRRFDLPSVPFMQAGAAPESVAMGHISINFPGGFSIAQYFAGASEVDLLANLPGGAYAIWAQVSATLWYGA